MITSLAIYQGETMGPQDSPCGDVLVREFDLSRLEPGKRYTIQSRWDHWMEIEATYPAEGLAFQHFGGTYMPIQFWCSTASLDRLPLLREETERPQNLKIRISEWLVFHRNEEGWQAFGPIDHIYERIF